MSDSDSDGQGLESPLGTDTYVKDKEKTRETGRTPGRQRERYGVVLT